MSTYFNVLGHASMIFDHVRNKAYEKAIFSQINTESVVLDLGSGLGLHGLMAAKAGAKKVYLVDPSPAVLVAEKVAKDNGLENVECIQGVVQDIDIEKVDMIISVFTGNFLLTEDLLPSLFYARDKFLKEGGVLIPSAAKMWVMPVQAQEHYQSNIANWQDDSEKSVFNEFGLSYKMLSQYANNSLIYDHFNQKNWSALAEPVQLIDLCFHQANKAECFNQVRSKTTNAGIFHGWLGWFDMNLESGQSRGANDSWLSTSPMSDRLHWSQAFMPSESPTDVIEGDELFLDLKRPEYSDWTWTTGLLSDDSESVKSQAKQQSTFLSEPLNLDDIQKKSPHFRGSLSKKGDILKSLLLMLDGTRTNQEIAELLMKKFPEKQTDIEATIKYVQQQVSYLC